MRDEMCECGWERRVDGCGGESVMRKEKLEVTRRSLIVRGENDTMPRCLPNSHRSDHGQLGASRRKRCGAVFQYINSFGKRRETMEGTERIRLMYGIFKYHKRTKIALETIRSLVHGTAKCHRSWNMEEMVCRPHVAIQPMCVLKRQRAGCCGSQQFHVGVNTRCFSLRPSLEDLVAPLAKAYCWPVVRPSEGFDFR